MDVVATWYSLLWRFSKPTGEPEVELGVLSAFNPRHRELARQRVASALTLIRELDPSRARRLARDLARVLVAPASEQGLYLHATRTCLIDVDVAGGDGATAENLALLLVHEATHARLAALGFRTRAGRRELSGSALRASSRSRNACRRSTGRGIAATWNGGCANSRSTLRRKQSPTGKWRN